MDAYAFGAPAARLAEQLEPAAALR